MRLAYLVTQYPKVSHTFIRREILELERRGHRVLRLAIRRPADDVVDAVDREEHEKTIYCLSQRPTALASAVLRTACRRPLAFWRSLRMALGMKRRSGAGCLRPLAYLAEACFFLRCLENRSIPHVHVHFGTNSASVARLIRTLGGPNYSMTIHGPAEFDDERRHDIGPKVGDSTFTAAISSYTSAQIRRWTDYSHWEKIHVVRCIVDEVFFQEAEPITADHGSLVCVGRLTPQKGQFLLIDALAKIVESGVDARLVLTGDGEIRQPLEERIREAGLMSRVHITGWVDEADVRKHLLQSRCLVLPSFAEGLPVVIMEAFALGRPVISTYVAGIPELVRPGENGWLIPAGDRDALAAAMREACAAPLDRLNRMGAAGRESTLRMHSAPTEIGKLEALLQTSLERSSTP